jgi:large-conductance mechanosensitive channel
VIEPTEDFVILSYRARAIRPDGGMYDAVASTGYVRRSGSWKLAFHQTGAPVVAYGMFLNTCVEFLIVAFTIFLVVRQMNKLRGAKPAA